MINYVNKVLASRKRGSQGVKIEGKRAKVYSLEINNNGVTASLAEHCRMAGVAYSTARDRLGRGMSLEDALKPETYYRKVEAFGVMDTLTGHCARHGVKFSTAQWRFGRGMAIEDVLNPNRHCKKILAFGLMDTLKNHCDRYGVKYGTVYNRINTQGKTLEQALTDSSGDN